MQIKLEIDDVVGRLLATLSGNNSAESVVAALIDHASQGVYRPGAWEREWVIQAFGVEFLERLVPGDPWGRRGMDEYFERPTEYSETA